jgi:hypothetical protein
MNLLRKLVSAACLALLSISYSASNAQDSTVIDQSTTVTTPVISDDGYAYVPLQFAFPLYGKSFTESWMYSNGIIGFQNPNMGLGWYNLSVQPIGSNMSSEFNYSIYALWTDLININGSFRTEGNSTFQRYSWLGISPYYDPNRLNTFSVEIRPDGKILANYTNLNVDYASVGITGDASKGEFDNIGYYPYSLTTGTLSNWERSTSGSDPCEADPLYSSSCPGYFDAIKKLTEPTSTQMNVVDSSASSPTQSSITTNTVDMSSGAPISSVTVVQSTTPVVSSAATTSSSAQSVQGAPAKVGEVRTSSAPAPLSMSQILNIVANEQSRISAVEKTVVQDAMAQVDNANAVANAQSESSSTSSVSSQAAASIVRDASVRLMQNNQSNSKQFDSTVSLAMSSPINYSITSRQSVQIDVEQTKTDSTQVGGRSLLDQFMQSRNEIETSNQTQQQSNVKKNVANNEAAGNVKVEDLSKQGANLALYMSLKIQDAAFYAPKEVYRNQRVVDNARLLRSLSGGSDALHQRMVDQQYK